MRKPNKEIEFLCRLVEDMEKALGKGMPRAYLATFGITRTRCNQAQNALAFIEVRFIPEKHETKT